MDTAPATMDPAMATTAARPTSRHRDPDPVVATGSGSASGMATDGGFAACRFAANLVHLRYKQVSRSRKPPVFGDVFNSGLKKPFFRPSFCKRSLWIDCCALSSDRVSFEWRV